MRGRGRRGERIGYVRTRVGGVEERERPLRQRRRWRKRPRPRRAFEHCGWWTSRRALLVLVGLTLGCAGLKDVTTFAPALQEHFHVPANVNVNNGAHLIVTFPNAPASVAGGSGKRAVFAREVAVFAKHTYPHPQEFEDVTVAFVVRSAGPITSTNTGAPYRWRLAELP